MEDDREHFSDAFCRLYLPVIGSLEYLVTNEISIFATMTTTNVMITVFFALDVVQSLGVAIGNDTAIRRSMLISVKKKPELLAKI